jgi:sacsin
MQDYPEGPGVLLELVQNADDAGATKAAFLLDMRQHGTASLLGPGMAAWQGPALLAYNNAIFSPGGTCFLLVFATIATAGPHSASFIAG